mgnify:CR=1 FL=1
MYKILIVEDDEVIAGAIKKHLDNWGYEARCVRDFSDVMKDFAQFEPHLVLMDVKLPLFNGYHWCQEIRKVSKVPVIFASSQTEDMNIVMAMNMGGDDYITKPFELEVLTAKIQAMLRRSYDFSLPSNIIEFDGVSLNVDEATLTFLDDKIELTKNELKILQILIENSKKVVYRDTIMTKLWESDSYVEENTLSVNVNRLRKKLESIGLTDFIVTKKGIGYRVG